MLNDKERDDKVTKNRKTSTVHSRCNCKLCMEHIDLIVNHRSYKGLGEPNTKGSECLPPGFIKKLSHSTLF